MFHNANNNNPPPNPNNPRNNRNNGRRTTSKYCWSHGACAHSSSECNSKKEGYKNESTFTNKMNGSTNYCN